MSSETSQKRLIIRWATVRGLAAIVVFIVFAVLAELLVVTYAMSLNINDETLLRWDFRFPITNSPASIAFSLLFHLVPITVIVALTFTWIFVTKNTTIRSPEAWKARTGQHVSRSEKATPKKSGALGSFIKTARSSFAKATIRSAFMVFFFFLVFVLVISLLVYPQLIYRTVSDLYRGNPSFLGFVEGIDAALAPIGGALNNFFSGPASAFRDFAVGVGGVLGFGASLDGDGKYLVFQNAAAWISALIGWTYVEFILKSRKSKRVTIRRS